MQETTHPGTVNTNVAAWAAALAALIFVFDRISKIYFMNFGVSHRQSIVRGFLDVVYHENHGIIANFPLPMPLTIFITLSVIVLILFGIKRSAKQNDLNTCLALGLILGGALGNLYDRITQEFVFDWILLFGRSAINVADIAIVIGAMWYFYQRSKKQKRPDVSERS